MGEAAQVQAGAGSQPAGASSPFTDVMRAANTSAQTMTNAGTNVSQTAPANMPAGGWKTVTPPTNPGPNYGAMALTTTGGLTSAYAKLLTGNTNAHIADNNAKIAVASATDTINAGDYKAGMAETRGRTQEGQIRAASAGQGVIAGAGSSGQVISQADRASSMDALLIQRNAAREALGYQAKAVADTNEALQAKTSGRDQALATILNTGSQDFLESDMNYGGFRGRGINL